VFSDAHVDPNPGWLEPLQSALDDPSVGEVAPTIRDIHRDDFAGYGFTWSEPGMSVVWLQRRPSAITDVPFICGCFLAMRRRDFHRLGGFDSGLTTWGFEDAELSLHVWRSGLRCVVVPESDVKHLFRSRFTYSVEWTAVAHNSIRVAATHFDAVALERVLAHWARHPSFPEAYARLDLGEVAVLRRRATATSERHVRWFFDHFEISALT
jgi:GT2 family glycosyltransferase